MPDIDVLRAENKQLSSLKNAYECFKSIDLISIQNIGNLLVAKYGLEKIVKICHCWKALPNTLTILQSLRYISKDSNIPEVEVKELVSFIQSSCPSLLEKLTMQNNNPVVLAPPTSTCFQCGKKLVSNHTCKVKYYTEEGASLVDKVTLRCIECKLYYNVTQFGNKSSLGFRFYPMTGEAADTVYAKRSLLEFQCALA